MHYTVHELATLAGVSVRTLHYYDQIGLLKPSFVKENGYRYYAEPEVLRLQQILFFRELEFPLEDIIKMMNAPDFNTKEALIDQKKLLELKKEKINRLIQTIETTISTLKGGGTMKNDDLFAPFTDKQMEEYKEEAKQRWGHTEAYKQSSERVSQMSKEEMKKLQEDGIKLTKQLAEAMDHDFKSPEVQALIEKHHAGIEVFYTCPPEMYRNLGKMYVEDKRFTAYYDRFRPGLAEFVCKAIEYWCDSKKIITGDNRY